MKFHAKKINNFQKVALSGLVLFFLANMLISPAKYIQCSLDGISAWAFNVLPSVLPFMFFTKVLSSLDTMSALTRPFSPLSKKIFKTPPISVYAFFMAILSGYPVGSKMVSDLFLQGKITKEDAFKMSSFCSTSGPMFIVGAVGIGMFKSATVGYVLFISHVLGAILNGLVYRNFKLKESAQNSQPLEEDKKSFDLSEIVLNSTNSILAVGCIITIFFIVIECFSPLFSLFGSETSAFLQGIVEITKGCLSLSQLPNVKLAVILCSFVISFGGISTVLQSLTMLSRTKMPVKLFITQKVTHAIFSCLVTLCLLVFFKF